MANYRLQTHGPHQQRFRPGQQVRFQVGIVQRAVQQGKIHQDQIQVALMASLVRREQRLR